MKQWLIRRIKKLFENIESTITTVIGLALLSSIGILALSKKALNFFLQIANIPTPLWATIVLVLLVAVYIKIANSTSKPPKNKIFFIDDKGYRWKVTTKPNGSYEVHDIPFCINHDRLFVYDVDKYICTHDEKGKLCINSIEEGAREALHKSAISLAEKTIRDKKLS